MRMGIVKSTRGSSQSRMSLRRAEMLKVQFSPKHNDQGRAHFEGRCNRSVTSTKTWLLEQSDQA